QARRLIILNAVVLAFSATAALAYTITEFPVSSGASNPLGITAGPDGNLWYVKHVGSRVGKMTTAGSFTEFVLPSVGGPIDITTGPDGNLWLVERDSNKVAKVTTAGVITEYTVPTGASQPQGIVAGPDGNLWIAETAGNKI